MVVPDVPAAFADSGSAEVGLRWWECFREPALDALVVQALQANRSLEAARQRLVQAAAVARRAGAELGPTLEASAGVGFTLPARRDAEWSLPLGVQARYELDLFGRVEASEAAARFEVEVARAQARAAGLALAGQVAQAYYLYGERRGQLRLLEVQVALNRQVLELVELRFRHGKVGAQDVLRQRQLVESAEGDRARLLAEVAVVEHQLAVLGGRAPGGEGPAEPTAELPPLPAAGVPADLVQRRPDLEAARLRVAAADRRVAVALADRFPRLSLSASAQSGDVREIMDNWVLNLGANLVAPLLDAGRRAAEVDRTRAVVDEAVAQYGQAVLEALAEVESALARGRQQARLVESLDRQLELARGAVDRARERFGAGAASYVDVLDALRTLQALERSRLTARREQFQHRIDLYRALAGGVPIEPPPARPERE